MVAIKFAHPDDTVGRGLVMKHRSFSVIATASKVKQEARRRERGMRPQKAIRAQPMLLG